MKAGKIVLIRWLDSSLTDIWSDNPNGELAEIESIGYLVFDGDKHISIAQSINFGDEQYGSILSIPKSVILKKKYLKV